MEKNMQLLLEDLDFVLKFSTEMIIQSLKVEKLNGSTLERVRNCCRNLTIAGVYKFDTDCDEQKLIEQIQEFSTHVSS